LLLQKDLLLQLLLLLLLPKKALLLLLRVLMTLFTILLHQLLPTLTKKGRMLNIPFIVIDSI
jgi:hypothetical protein